MKAKVKRTGQIVEVLSAFGHRDGVPAIAYEVLGHPGIKYRPKELEFNVTFDYIEEVVSEIQTVNIGYWEQLKHQAAIAAMQGLVTRGEVLGSSVQEIARDIAEISCEVAHALVEKLKEKEEEK